MSEPTPAALVEPTAVPAPPPAPPGRLSRLQALRSKHAKAEVALFFTLGLLFDIATLGRIDDQLNLVSQAVYLAILGGLLCLEERALTAGWEPPGFLRKAWPFATDVIHFLFGSLLSAFTLFYLRSASDLLGLAFLFTLGALLLANELPRFRALGPPLRFALFGFCLTSYLAYLLPSLAGFLSAWLFGAAVAVGALASLGMARLVGRWTGGTLPVLKRVLLPGLLVQALLLGLYFARAIPPVPLSLQFIGIYHDVQRTPDGYQLSHQRPAWRFWHSGDQQFLARPGDKVWVFVRVFAPMNFRDNVFIRWRQKDPARGWQDWGAPFPLEIRGKKNEVGFASFANKSNYTPGDWKAQVETADGRVVGGITFRVDADDSAEPRAFYVESR